jgi:ribonuclease-3
VAESTSYDELFGQLGLVINAQLLELALTHRSYAYESGGIPTNERLEFLGDSVLGIVVTDALYHRHADLPEGQLAKLRSAVVNARALAGVARTLSLGSYIRLGKGEEATGGRDKSSILADTVEAILGAAYLDHGIDVARELVLRLFDELLTESATLGAGLDWKTSLQELTAELSVGVPSYTISEDGPDHAKEFQARVVLGDALYGFGKGSNKKEAEQEAAATAYAELIQLHRPE